MKKTDLLTVLGAVGGLLQYTSTNTTIIPQDKQGWTGLLVAVVVAAAGYLAKGDEKNEQPK